MCLLEQTIKGCPVDQWQQSFLGCHLEGRECFLERARHDEIRGQEEMKDQNIIQPSRTWQADICRDDYRSWDWRLWKHW